MRRKKPPINWSAVEDICRRSFTGGRILEDEQTTLQDAYQRDPEEYARRTAAVREEERSRLRAF